MDRLPFAADACSFTGSLPDAPQCALPALVALTAALLPRLAELVRTPLVRHYKVHLYRDCPFWREHTLCTNRDCSVASIDDQRALPIQWRLDALAAIESPAEGGSADAAAAAAILPGCHANAADFCYLDVPKPSTGISPDPGAQYVDLLANPERFTGYAGPSAAKVWHAIYAENCFGIVDPAAFGQEQDPVDLANELIHPPSQQAQQPKPSDSSTDIDQFCLEKRVFWRLLSGMHASISSHICTDHLLLRPASPFSPPVDRLHSDNDDDDDDDPSREAYFGPSLPCFIERLANHPERLQNMYFLHAILLRALHKLSPWLVDSPYLQMAEDDRAKALIQQIAGLLEPYPSAADQDRSDADSNAPLMMFNETQLFHGPDALQLKQEFKHHFRNISRIMDCVGCDKCRLWGKVQVTGIGTALKILFELDEAALDPVQNPNLLQRTEVVALLNTVHRTSESVAAVSMFKDLWLKTATESDDDARADVTANHKDDSVHPPESVPVESLKAMFDVQALINNIRGFVMTLSRKFHTLRNGRIDL